MIRKDSIYTHIREPFKDLLCIVTEKQLFTFKISFFTKLKSLQPFSCVFSQWKGRTARRTPTSLQYLNGVMEFPGQEAIFVPYPFMIDSVFLSSHLLIKRLPSLSSIFDFFFFPVSSLSWVSNFPKDLIPFFFSWQINLFLCILILLAA